MGKQLKVVDILGEVRSERKETKTSKKSVSKPVSEPSIEDRERMAQEVSEDKPSAYQTELRAKLRKKKQMNFSDVPVFIADEFERLRDEAGMNKKEFLYHLLRERGADIPPYEEMDGRKL